MIPGTGFGHNVKRAREEKGWSRAEVLRRLADMGIDMYAMTIKRIEDGEQAAKVHEAVGLARVFDTTVEELEHVAPDTLGDELEQAARVLRRARANAVDSVEALIEAEKDLRRLIDVAKSSGEGESYLGRAELALMVTEDDWADLLRSIGGR